MMIVRPAALILLSALSLMQTLHVPHQLPLFVAELGDTLNLTCTDPTDQPGMFYWYKMNIGLMVQTVAQGSFSTVTLDKEFPKSKFNVTKEGAVYSLTIRNVSKEDEATYFCQVGSAYSLSFINGTLLAVNDPQNQQKSVEVKQSPDVVSVPLGDSMSLQCSLDSMWDEKTDQCPGGHRVHWFRAGSGSHPGIIYNASRDEQKERRCVYRLSKTVRDSSDAGTYYCAVVTCGEILFGEGTIVETRQDLLPLVIVLGALLFCCVLGNIALIFTRKKKPVCEHKGDTPASYHFEQSAAAEAQPSNEDDEAVGVNYVVLDFPSRKTKRFNNTVEVAENCLYSNMRDYQ